MVGNLVIFVFNIFIKIFEFLMPAHVHILHSCMPIHVYVYTGNFYKYVLNKIDHGINLFCFLNTVFKKYTTPWEIKYNKS